MIPGEFGAHKIVVRGRTRHHVGGSWGHDGVQAARAAGLDDFKRARRGRSVIAVLDEDATASWEELRRACELDPCYFALATAHIRDATDSVDFAEIGAFASVEEATAARAGATAGPPHDDVAVLAVWLDAVAIAYLANGIRRRRAKAR